jgi:hypothetical protein
MHNPVNISEYSEGDLFCEPEAIREHVRYPFLVCIFTLFAVSFTLFISYNWELYKHPNMILGGALLKGGSSSQVEAHQLGSLEVILFGFLAAYVWALWQLFHRMVDRDVTVYAFHVITIRVVTTIVLAITIYQLFKGTTPYLPAPGSQAYNNFIFVAFAIGFFPEVMLRWLSAKARAFFQKGEPSSYLDVEAIEGIDTFTRARLAEAGIAEANHLANSNPVTLAIRTPFGLPLLVDWAGQAQLLVLLKEAKFNRLRAQGIRTSVQFYHQFCSQVAANPIDVPEMSGDEIRLACASLNVDPSFRRLKELAEKMLGSESTPR